MKGAHLAHRRLAWNLLLIASLGVIFPLQAAGASDGLIGAGILSLNAVGLVVLFGLKVADAWEKAVLLRVGRFG